MNCIWLTTLTNHFGLWIVYSSTTLTTVLGYFLITHWFSKNSPVYVPRLRKIHISRPHIWHQFSVQKITTHGPCKTSREAENLFFKPTEVWSILNNTLHSCFNVLVGNFKKLLLLGIVFLSKSFNLHF